MQVLVQQGLVAGVPGAELLQELVRAAQELQHLGVTLGTGAEDEGEAGLAPELRRVRPGLRAWDWDHKEARFKVKAGPPGRDKEMCVGRLGGSVG